MAVRPPKTRSLSIPQVRHSWFLVPSLSVKNISGFVLPIAVIHSGRGICTSSPTFPPHWWNDITTYWSKIILKTRIIKENWVQNISSKENTCIYINELFSRFVPVVWARGRAQSERDAYTQSKYIAAEHVIQQCPTNNRSSHHRHWLTSVLSISLSDLPCQPTRSPCWWYRARFYKNKKNSQTFEEWKTYSLIIDTDSTTQRKRKIVNESERHGVL